MKVTIEKKELVIRIPMTPATPSKTGKTFSVASSHGNQKTGCVLTEGEHKGKEITVDINAYVK